MERQSPPCLKPMIGLLKCLASGLKVHRRSRIKLKQFVVAWDHGAHARLIGQCGGLVAPKVARDSALGRSTVDGQKSQIDPGFPQAVCHAREQNRVSRMIQGPLPVRLQLQISGQHWLSALLVLV